MSHHQSILNKIMTLEQVGILAKQWKQSGLKVVFTNGCFDILHRGHVDYLSKSADLGNKLVVGLNTDASVKRQGKSPSRPIQDEQSRAQLMASFGFVDAVVLFDEDTPLNLIKTVLPDVLVKGADYKAEDVVGYKEVTENGGQVKTLEYLQGFSTSAIEKKILGLI